MLSHVDTTIVGAGPYGLSIAAHLRAAGSECRVVGTPMHTWLTAMPDGMMLKSAGISSTLYDPRGSYTLEKYCAERGMPYQHMGLPVSLKMFSEYGLAFQQRFVPDALDDEVRFVDRTAGGFRIDLRDAGSFTTRKVVLAVGLSYFRNIPDVLADLPDALRSHSSANKAVGKYKGRDVIVVGGGSSAIDLAVLLHEAGANARLVARRPALDFNAEERWPRPIHERIRQPMTGVGPGWKNLILTEVLPWIYPYFPDDYKIRTLKRTLGPAAGWFMRDRIEGVAMHLGRHLVAAAEDGSRVRLELGSASGTETLVADHVIAATGYRTDVRKLSFLSEEIRKRIAVVAAAPSLSSSFESSVPGLYFAGPITAPSAGPIMRFSVGAGFTSRRISRAIGQSALAA
ncbi:NAD(P)-binding domain-containing protein [Methylorubrum sp. SB2]|uniref:NAD(P)-binding domain-containing protein n=1 Tax=Methylorubrum subtropicum TaxID=3138812 RepID=UPI00313DE910